MNWSHQIFQTMQDCPNKLALWTAAEGPCTFSQLSELIRRTQSYFRSNGLVVQDHVLFLDQPGPRLYAAILAAIGLGASALFVEPWMPAHKINEIVNQVKPKIFWSPRLGQLWAWRIPSIRAIPHWTRPKQIDGSSDPQDFVAAVMQPNDRAILSFSSGTSGQPKGIPRSHGYLDTVIKILQRFDDEVETSPELVLFPNLVFYHLSRKRGSILASSKWNAKNLRDIAQLPKDLRPNSLCCNPTFLKTIAAIPEFPKMRWMAVGGALIDCDILEAAIRRFPETPIEVIYGSTEVEPVSHVDARQALARSRERNLFQSLYLGQPISEIEYKSEADALWVCGPHVTTEYVMAGSADQQLKKRDEKSRIWHNMGDRIEIDAGEFWYGGRSFQKSEDFKLEQKIYSSLASSASFIMRNPGNKLVLIGENLKKSRADLQAKFPELEVILEAKIIRDRRHRSRIDRQASLKPVLKSFERI